jgi:uncharacterized MAPEG superfamily protein
MTKEKYMALADLQNLWSNSIKPWIVSVYATKAELQQTLDDAIDAASDANEAAGNANDAAQAANEAAEAAAAAVVVAELAPVATESNVRAIVSGYSPSSSE